MQQDWQNSFFSGIALESWWLAVTPEWTESDVEFLASALNVQTGSRILDVPCGNGRHSISLARRGARVTGIDLAKENIAEARRLAGSVEVEWRISDMRDLAFVSEFDGAFCFGNSFGYLDRKGTAEFVSSVARALKPGGRFIVETGVAAESILTSSLQRRWFVLGDIFMLCAQQYDPVRSRLQTDYTFLRDGKSETRGVWYWVLTVADIRSIFEQAGFEVDAMYAGVDRVPYSLGSPQLILVARLMK